MTVDGAYKITAHAQRRIRSRNLRTEHVYNALFYAQPRPMAGGVLAYDDNRSCVRVIVDPARRHVITAYRLTRYTGKRRKRGQ
jgi:hypothetical protein